MKHIILVIGITLALVYSASSCKCAAPKENEEVCGSDGKNVNCSAKNCDLNNLRIINVIHTGKTYDSKCMLFCASIGGSYTEVKPCLTTVHNGTCSSPACICKDLCNYVCGSDG